MNLLRRLRGDATRSTFPALSVDDYLHIVNEFVYNGVTYPFGMVSTYRPTSIEQAGDLAGHMAAVKACPPAFAAQLVRSLVLSQARFTFRNHRWAAQDPGKTFGARALQVLENPWPNATTGELLSKMEWHAGLAGNAYVWHDRPNRRLRVLRPDWVQIVLASRHHPDEANLAPDSELAAYVYWLGGPAAGGEPVTLMPEDVAHWSPLPDPEAGYRGMSWITPALQDIKGDRLATEHKLKFFEYGATPNLVVTGVQAPTEDQFRRIVEKIENRHAGVQNAYRTLVLGDGADVSVVGANLQQMAFKETQGAGETRIAMLSRVPAVVLGASEGLAGSSLNAGNYGQARRNFADSWLYPTLQSACSALARIVDVPPDAELWFDTSDMPFVREDARDAAEIEHIKATTIRTYVDGGFDPVTVVGAVAAQDVKLLKHTGKLSVQLQEPGTQPPPPPKRAVRVERDDVGQVLAIVEGE